MAAGLVSAHCLDLKRAYRKNMALGFGVSAAMHFAAIGTILLIMAIGAQKPIEAPEIVIKSITDIMTPPTISPQQEQLRMKSEARNIPPVIGIPKAVPEEEAPEEIEIATQNELAAMAPTTPVEDLSQVGVNVDVGNILDELLPAETVFVPFEEQPVKVIEVSPIYPPLAQRAGMEGDVYVKVLVDREGKVRDVKIAKESGANAGFEETAAEAAYKTVWKPAIANGLPIAVWTTYRIRFRLKN